MRAFKLVIGALAFTLIAGASPVMAAIQVVNRVAPPVLQIQQTDIVRATDAARVNMRVVNPASLQYVKMTSPNGGEKLVMDGSNQKITFVANLDPAKDGHYQFQLELWRSGKKVGNINCAPQAFSLENINTGFGMPQYQIGAYCVGGGAPDNYFVAESGNGYKIKVVTYLAGEEIFSDESDTAFSYVAGPPLGTPEVTLVKPNGGESYEIGKGGNVQFSFSGINPYKFNHEAGFELFKDGVLLGNLIGRESLNLQTPLYSLSLNIDQYQDQTLKPVIVKPGSGYKLRVIIYENGQVVAQDDSDYAFSFTAPAKTNAASKVLIQIQGWFGKISGIFKK
jgi:hypothetical protein